MEGIIPDFFRKRSLRKHESTVPTKILPLGEMKSYVAILDVEDVSYNQCKTEIMNFFRRFEINGIVFFQDFRDIESEERLITSIQTTITKKDVNWFGKPSEYKLEVMRERDPDLLLCLVENPGFSIEYLARTSSARFKVGRKQLGNNVFDLVMTAPEGKEINQLECFCAVRDLLLKIH